MQWGSLFALVLLVFGLNGTSAKKKPTLIAADDDLSQMPFQVTIPCKTTADSEDASKGCYPSGICKRWVGDDIFTDEDIDKLLAVASKGYATRDTLGGPTILDINTGFIRDSAGTQNLFAHSASGAPAIFSDDDFAAYGRIIDGLRQHVMKTMGATDLHFTAPTFITRLDGRADWQPQEIHDEYWHVHADRNNTAHYHYSGLLYLSEYGDDFEGGRFLFYNADTARISDIVEPHKGRVVVFSSGHENPHKVERVTSGQRLVLAFWFTCDEGKKFEIFLDGKSHSTFSQKVGKSVLQQQRDSARRDADTARRQQQNDGSGVSEL